MWLSVPVRGVVYLHSRASPRAPALSNMLAARSKRWNGVPAAAATSSKSLTKKTIDGWNKKNLARYINHSCRPNCEIQIRKGRVFVMAKRPIKPSEELAYYYGEEYVEQGIKPIGCKCLRCQPATKDRKNRRTRRSLGGVG